MKESNLVFWTLSIFFMAAIASLAPQGSTAQSQDAMHKVVAPDEVKWGPGPPTLPAGAEMAVINGDPGQSGPFTIRFKAPDGYKVAPHWHPTDENLVVLKGTFNLGLGEKYEKKGAHKIPTGGYGFMPKEVRHFAWTDGETIIQVYGMGPFQINYVNPEDDPRNKK